MNEDELEAIFENSHAVLDSLIADNLAADRAILAGSVAGLVAEQAKSAREAIGITDGPENAESVAE